MREAQLPGVPVSPSLGPAKTTTAIPARSDLAAPAFAMATNGPDAGRKTVQRCFVEHLRVNLERHPEMARDVDLPSTLESHHCCDFETIGAITPTHLAPLHANVHDPHGPDGVAAVVHHIKDKSNDLTRAEIMMRARAANVQQSDDVSLSVDECVVWLKDPMSSQRITEPGKGAKCEHVECFDLVTFLRATLRATRYSQRSRCADPARHPMCHPQHTANKKVGRCDYCRHWRCPICRKPLGLNVLEYDAFIADVLAKTSAERVKVKPSTSQWEVVRGSARPPPRNNESDSEDEAAEAFARRDEAVEAEAPAPGTAGRAIVIDLDAEERAPAPSEAQAQAEEEEPQPPPPVPQLTEVPPPPPLPRITEVPPPPVSLVLPARPPVDPAPSESPRAMRRRDTSPAKDPRPLKAPRRAAVAIAPMDPVGAAARPTSTVTTTVTLAARPAIPPVRIPAAAPPARRVAATTSVSSVRGRTDPLVNPDVFARVGAVLKTVATAFRAEDASEWCERASQASAPKKSDDSAPKKSNECRALDQLAFWVEKLYADTRALTHGNRDALKATLTRHNTGDAFQKFRKLVRQKRLCQTTRVGWKIHAILEFMTHTRDWWKAVYRNLPLPKALPLNRDGSYKTPPMDVWTTLSDEDAEDGAAAASTEKVSTKKVKESTSKANAKEKKRARAEAASPPPGAAKKFAANAVRPSAAAAPTPKPKQKRRLPSHCDARGHGHCEWNRSTPLKAHPKLKHVAICEGCHAFYCSTPFNVGRDGYFEQCRCCSDGHERIVCCDQCSQVFCQPCIANLGGKAYAKDVHDVETWRCFSCDPDAVAKGR